MQYYDPDTYRFAQVYLLVDCNNFFCSCERLFRPDLEGRPLLVLSNNDGCVIARSYESKALGIPMGIPVFKIRHLIRRHHIVCFSSNFALYSDISRRVMTILEQLSEHCAIYSVDEAFLSFTELTANEALAHAVKIRNAIATLVGIKVGIGIARTKTLAKLANHHAKSARAATYGIYSLLQELPRQSLLQRTPVAEVWGVGRRLTERLHDEGITTAAQLAAQNQTQIKRRYNVVLARTVAELNNISALADEGDPNPTASSTAVSTAVSTAPSTAPALSTAPTLSTSSAPSTPIASSFDHPRRAPSYQIMWSRSYTERLTTQEQLHQAIANYLAAACHKLRHQQQYCRELTVFIRTSYYDAAQYRGAQSVRLKVPSADTRELLSYATNLLEQIFMPGYHYSKAGIILGDLCASRTYQADLLEQPDLRAQERSDRLMAAIDHINRQGSAHHIFLAAQGTTQERKFTHQKALSPRYTSSWEELPQIE